MTVAAQNSSNGFQGDGSTTVFTFTFALPSDSSGTDILLFVIDPEGVITPLTSNFTLDLIAQTITYPVTPGEAPLDTGVAALPAGWQLWAMRVESLVQALALTTQGPFPSAGLMLGLDKIVMMLQQLQEQIDRCVKYPIGQVPTTTDVTAFIAAVSAAIIQAPITGTYAYCKEVAAANPTQWRFGLVNDQNDAGVQQLFLYCGDASAGDQGWFGPLTGGA